MLQEREEWSDYFVMKQVRKAFQGGLKLFSQTGEDRLYCQDV